MTITRLAPAMLTALLLSATTAGANLLQNGSFSAWSSPTQPEGWVVEFATRVQVDQSNDPVHSSPHSAKLTRLFSGTGDNNGVRQFIPVQRSQTYTLSAWYHDISVDVRGGVGITWCRADSTALPGGSPPVAYTDSAIRDWQRLELTATSPDSPSLALVKVYLRCYGFTGNQPNGVVHLDDAEFVEGAGAVTEASEAAAQVFFKATTLTTGGFRFSIGLPAERNVKLELYDMTGTRRGDIFEGRLAAGRRTVTTSTDQTASLNDGVYFAVLTGATLSPITRRITLVR